MENRVKTREIRGKTKVVCERRDLAFNGERTETSMVELAGRSSGLDIPAKQPDQLIRLILG